MIGHRDTTLASHLAANTELQVLLLLDDKDAVQEARDILLRKVQPLSGHVSVQVHDRSRPLPFADYAFNLITTTSDVALQQTAELHRVLRPAGGILHVAQATDKVKQALNPFTSW